MNDYHAFKSTGGGSGGGGGKGCFPWKPLTVIIILYAILTWFGECKYG